jgi:uncharacterized Tic20 family protein
LKNPYIQLPKPDGVRFVHKALGRTRAKAKGTNEPERGEAAPTKFLPTLMVLRQKICFMPEEYPLSPPTSEERTMGILAHILAIVPGVGILGPLVIYLIKKDSQFVQENAKESLNFQITVYLALIVSGILAFVIVGYLFLAVIGIAEFVLVIIAAIKASENKIYRYPVNLRLIK